MSSPSVPAVTCEGSRRPRRLIAFIERSSIYADWDWRIETSCQNGLHSVHTRSGHAEAPLACMQLAEEAAACEGFAIRWYGLAGEGVALEPVTDEAVPRG